MRATVAPCRQIVMIISSDRSKFHHFCGVSQRHAQNRYRSSSNGLSIFRILAAVPLLIMLQALGMA